MFNLNDNKLYKIVDMKVIDIILYILSARINTVSYNDMNHGICYIAYIMTITQNPFMQYNAQLYEKNINMSKRK